MSNVVGLDEVGRGCWAGPLVAAAVLLPENFLQNYPFKLRDSKKMTRNQREAVAAYIQSQVKSIGVGWVIPGEIDQLGLTKSVRLAMLRALKELHKTGTDYDQIIIDGNVNFFRNVSGLKTDDVQAIIRADDTVPAVSAASIIAKVARDGYMREAAISYPGFGFESHVGYGTAAHIAALTQYGTTDIHRKSYKPVQKFS